jgi:OmpA-OmpF porin, OOP family
VNFFLIDYQMELNMKKKLLCCALLAGIGMAQTAAAQSYDDRWYIGAGVGVGFFDNDRHVSDEMYGVLGLGKMITPNISIDAELWHSNPDLTDEPSLPGSIDVPERNWELMSLSIVGRYHFTNESRNWAPYVAVGIGAQEHHDGTTTTPVAFGYQQSRTGTEVVMLLGLGATWDLGYPYLRTEIGARVDMDDGGAANDDYLVDGYAGIEFLFPIGPEAVPAPPPVPPPAKTCADLDDDGDGVNNCDDKCPGSTAGEAVGADGCPVPPPPVEEPKPFRG